MEQLLPLLPPHYHKSLPVDDMFPHHRPHVAISESSDLPHFPTETFDWTEPFHSIMNNSSNVSDVAENVKTSTDDRFSPLEVFDKNSTQDESKKRPSGVMIAPLRRKKKPKSLPKRPLSAYNFYFQQLRADLKESEETSQLGFDALGKIVGKRWGVLPEEEREKFQELADRDLERYRREMEDYQKIEAKKAEESVSAAAPSFQEAASPLPSFRHTGRFAPYPPAPYSSVFRPFPHPHQPYGTTAWAGHSASFIPPTVVGQDHTNGASLPAGSEVNIRDANGELRPYTVQYQMVTMSRQEANDYMARMAVPK